MRGFLDILHEWKNVLNRSFVPKREYRFIATDHNISFYKNSLGTVEANYTNSSGAAAHFVVRFPFTYDNISDAKVGTEVVVTWDEKTTSLTIDRKKIV